MSETQYAERETRRGPGRRRDIPPAMIIIALVIVCVIAVAGYFIFNGEDTAPETPEINDNENDMEERTEVYPDWIKQDLIVRNEYSRPGTPLKKVNGIVVHYIGNPGTTAKQNRNYFNNLALTGDTYASSHFIIDLDGSVIQCIPLDEIAYASNDRNNDTVAIECCHPDDSGEFTEETYEALIKLTKWLMELYELEAEDVIRHYDVTGKICPKYYVENPDKWEKFLEDIA